MSRQPFSIWKDEQLSIEIRKYLCSFDKTNGEYKKKDCVENAWKETDNSLGIEEDITLCWDYFNFYFMTMIKYNTNIFQSPKFTSGQFY